MSHRLQAALKELAEALQEAEEEDRARLDVVSDGVAAGVRARPASDSASSRVVAGVRARPATDTKPEVKPLVTLRQPLLRVPCLSRPPQKVEGENQARQVWAEAHGTRPMPRLTL